jgi:hypothetical protein
MRKIKEFGHLKAENNGLDDGTESHPRLLVLIK